VKRTSVTRWSRPIATEGNTITVILTLVFRVQVCNKA
jgi:hypothetical protein